MKIAVFDSLTDAVALKTMLLSHPSFIEAEIEVYTDSLRLLESLGKGKAFDIVFLCFDFGDAYTVSKHIRSFFKNTVLVITGSELRYTLEAFECDAVGFILKPFGDKEVFNAASKAYSRYKKLNPYHIIKLKNGHIRISVKELYYVEHLRRHIIYHTESGNYETVGVLSDAYDKLKDLGFYQVHQGYIVNLDKVCRFEGNDLVLTDNSHVPVSIRKKSEVVSVYMRYMGKSCP